MKRPFVILLTLLSPLACGEIGDIKDIEDPSEEAADDPVLGQATNDGTCDEAHLPLIEKSLSMGRSAAVSPAFAQCMQRLGSRTEYASGHVIGPYRPCTGDPLATAALSTQITQAIAF